MWFYSAHVKMAIDIAGHACAQVGRPQIVPKLEDYVQVGRQWKHKEEWSSTNKCIYISNAMFIKWRKFCSTNLLMAIQQIPL